MNEHHIYREEFDADDLAGVIGAIMTAGMNADAGPSVADRRLRYQAVAGVGSDLPSEGGFFAAQCSDKRPLVSGVRPRTDPRSLYSPAGDGWQQASNSRGRRNQSSSGLAVWNGQDLLVHRRRADHRVEAKIAVDDFAAVEARRDREFDQ